MQDRSPKISLNARGPLVGVVLVLLSLSNTLINCIPLYIMILLKLLTPSSRGRRWWTRRITGIAKFWMKVNLAMADFFLGTHWQIEVPDGLSMRGTYLITSNHQSWVDILALQKALISEVPFFRFFLKRELIYVPLLGVCWWGLEYPFMRRHTKAEIAKDPSLKTKDMDTARLACERYKGHPVAVMNFMEGTRYTDKKAERSPYKNLLGPKAGGMALVLNAMGEQIDCLLNVTIIYPQGVREMWDYLCGRLPQIRVLVERVELPAEFVGGNYQTDDVYRQNFQAWVTTLWQAKDELIEQQLIESKA